MAGTYSYGPLKSDYFTQYEKMWIEGYCKERSIVLSESNVLSVFTSVFKDKTPMQIVSKISTLINEADKFSNYAKGLFEKSWNNILGYSMNVVKPSGTINENQVESLKKISMYWLKEAPKIMSEELRNTYFNIVILETVSESDSALKSLDTFSPINPYWLHSRMLENAKKNFSYDKITMKYPPLRINPIEIKKNEAVLNMIPESDRLIAMIAWTAEGVLLLNNKNEHK